MTLGRRVLSACMCFAIATASGARAQINEALPPAVGLDGADGIIEAFRSHSVVAMGEGVGHGHEQGHAFLRALIRDPRFARAADDVVVEWGNSLYQDVIDQFTRGEDVPYGELRKVWENTTQPQPVWDSRVYREFFETVRSRNETLPEVEQIRVLLGDPPVDWELPGVRAEQRELFRQRDSYPAELIRREVVEKGRRALVVYGGRHLTRLPEPANPFIRGDAPRETIVSLLSRAGIGVFNAAGVPSDVAAQVQPDVAAWTPVRLTLIENTPLGAAPAQKYSPGDGAARMQEQWDALVIYGPISTMTWSSLPPELCEDEAWVEMRIRRAGYDDRREFMRRYCEPPSANQ